MKIAILGFGVDGHSAYDYWNTDENVITICDKDENIDIPKGVDSHLGSDYLSGLNSFDLIIRSPGLHPVEIINANDIKILSKITSTTNEFFKICPTKNIIGVTGTKGKGTTSTLISKLLETAGHRIHLAGNIGNPAIDLIKHKIQKNDWVVLELSSFQLIDLEHSPHIAVCLMVEPEHLDWHANFDEYVNAKKNIFTHQTEQDIAIYFADNEYSKQLALASPGQHIAYFSDSGADIQDGHIVIASHVIGHTGDIKLIGKHNWQNVCAAITAYWQIDQNISAAREAIFNFRGLNNRLEQVREQNDIRYFNDSFSSTPIATIAAIDSIKGQKIMIIGGLDRGLDLANLVSSIKQHESEIKKVILIGASSKRVSEELKKVNFAKFEVSEVKSMTEIINLATAIAQPGDSIVLSPGFPSFDMFKNFEERGTKFRETVNNL